MSNVRKTAKSRREGALPDGHRPGFGAEAPSHPPPPHVGTTKRLTAAIRECEAVLASGRLPDSIGHGDAFDRLLRLLRELGPPESVERYLTQRNEFASARQ